jgi:hypothetical protein
MVIEQLALVIPLIDSFFYLTIGILTLTVPIGAIAYVLLLPVAIIMRLHFRTVNLILPSGNTAMAKSVADRVEMPDTFRYLQTINNVLPKITDFFIGATAVSLLIIFLGQLNPYINFANAGIGLLLVRLLVLPLFKRTVQSRAVLLATFQNRLIASSKQAKDEQSEIFP